MYHPRVEPAGRGTRVRARPSSQSLLRHRSAGGPDGGLRDHQRRPVQGFGAHLPALSGARQPLDLVVVGGGIVGLATAREWLLRHPGAAVAVLEKEPEVGRHQSGQNSGVVHSGIYYAPGSLRARLCIEGAARLREFCAEHQVPVLQRGKLVVAVSEIELPRLAALRDRAEANGVRGVDLLGPGEAQTVEPHVRAVAALHVPDTAVVDFAAVCRRLAADIETRGGSVRCGVPVRGAVPHGDHLLVGTADEVVATRRLVLCPGLWADRLATAVGAPAWPRILPVRGDFWRLRPPADGLVRGLVYPVPRPGLPFLGVHATRRVDDTVWIGPNAVVALSRDPRQRGRMDWRDARDDLLDGATVRFLARHWSVGLVELARARSRRLLTGAVRRYLPDVEAKDLVPAGFGVRAQAIDQDGRLVDDFVVWRRGPIVAVRNAPSPAATAALAIAAHIVDAALTAR